MKQKLLMLLLVITAIISCSREEEKFIGNWILLDNICDTLKIENKNNNLFVYSNGNNRTFSAKIIDNFLEIYGDNTAKASLINNDTLVLGGLKFYKENNSIGEKFNLNGSWNIIECNEQYEPISIIADTIEISVGAPLIIYGVVKKLDDRKYEIFYSSGGGSIYTVENIIKPIEKKINYNKKIGDINVISTNEIELDWYGVPLIDNSKWLEGIAVDPMFWGEKLSNSNEINEKIKLFRNH